MRIRQPIVVVLLLTSALVGDDAVQLDARKAWGELRRTEGWRSISLDAGDPVGARAPHYYEETDGWVQAMGPDSRWPFDEAEDFPISRLYYASRPPVFSLVMYVRTRRSSSTTMARIVVRCGPESHRELDVLWNGKPVARFDTHREKPEVRDFFVTIPSPLKDNVHELRVAGADNGRSASLRRVEITGEAVTAWVEKPPLPSGGALELLSASYLPDPEPPPASQAVQGRRKPGEETKEGLQSLYRDHEQFGAVRIVYRNASAVAVRVANRIRLNGAPIEEQYVDFKTSPWDARGVVWYRVRPRSLEPGECGQLYLRFRRRPEGSATRVEIQLEKGTGLDVSIPYVSRPVRIDYVTLGRDGKTLYVYARRQRGAPPVRLTGVGLDGKALESVSIHGADFPGNVALALAKPSERLRVGEHHIASVTTSDGTKVSAQFRVLPYFFPRSSIHVPSNLVKPMHMNLLTWRFQGHGIGDALGFGTTALYFRVLDAHPDMPYIFAPDEPDANDNRGGGHAVGLGWYARMLQDTGWQDLVERHSPAVVSWMNMNGTTRPLNWAVYGQVGDVGGFDPYPVAYYGADHAYVRESLGYARLACAPTRMHVILEAYGWKEMPELPPAVRGPLPEEYRQNAIQAIGSGMKGLTSWVYSSNASGWQNNAEVAAEITKINRLIEHIEDDLLIGTPVDLAQSDAGQVLTGGAGDEHWPKERVWAGALLCGPDALFVAAANHIPASKPELPRLSPTTDVTIRVRLPDFLDNVKAAEVTENGEVAYPVAVSGREALLRIESIVSGRLFVLRRKVGQ